MSENKSVFKLTDSDKQARTAIAKGAKETQFLMSDLSARYPTEKPSDAWLTICKEENEWIVAGGKFVGLNKALQLTTEIYTVYLLACEAAKRGEGEEPAKMAIHTAFENATTLNRIRVQQTADKKAHERALKALQADEEKEENEDMGITLEDTDAGNDTAVIEVQEKFDTVTEKIQAIAIAAIENRKATKEDLLTALDLILQQAKA